MTRAILTRLGWTVLVIWFVVTVTFDVGFGAYRHNIMQDQNVSLADANLEDLDNRFFLTYSQLRQDLLTFGQPGFFNAANLPAGTDISRLHARIGALDREVGRLNLRLEQQFEGVDGAPGRKTTHGDSAESDIGGRQGTSRGRAQRAARP